MRFEASGTLHKLAAGRLSLHSPMHSVLTSIEVTGPTISGPESSRAETRGRFCNERVADMRLLRGPSNAELRPSGGQDADQTWTIANSLIETWPRPGEKAPVKWPGRGHHPALLIRRAAGPRRDDIPPELVATRLRSWIDTARTMTTADEKVLCPRLPPGRADRKALAYTNEIQRLRALGYTFEAIRLALADAGVNVGLTTVKREAARGAAAPHRPTWPSTPVPANDRRSPSSAVASDPPAAAVNRRSGRQIAEEFVQSHVSNPLVRAQHQAAGSDAAA